MSWWLRRKYEKHPFYYYSPMRPKEIAAKVMGRALRLYRQMTPEEWDRFLDKVLYHYGFTHWSTRQSLEWSCRTNKVLVPYPQGEVGAMEAKIKEYPPNKTIERWRLADMTDEEWAEDLAGDIRSTVRKIRKELRK
jgi:hypothetical protein